MGMGKWILLWKRDINLSIIARRRRHSPQLYFNRKYSLHYVWDPETLNDGMVRIYSGREIYNALNSINKLTDKEVEDYMRFADGF